jgi:hypothetical protein
MSVELLRTSLAMLDEGVYLIVSDFRVLLTIASCSQTVLDLADGLQSTRASSKRKRRRNATSKSQSREVQSAPTVSDQGSHKTPAHRRPQVSSLIFLHIDSFQSTVEEYQRRPQPHVMKQNLRYMRLVDSRPLDGRHRALIGMMRNAPEKRRSDWLGKFRQRNSECFTSFCSLR